MFSNPSTYRDIYGASANTDKPWHLALWPQNANVTSTFACLDKRTHRRRRRNLDQAFSDRAVRSAEPFIIKHSDQWGQLLADGAKDGWSEPRNMTEWTNSFQFDIMCDLSFGWTYDTKIPGPNKLRTVPHDIEGYMKFMYTIFYSPIIGIWLFLKPRGLDKLFANMTPPSVQFFVDFVNQSLLDRIEREKINEKTGKRPEREDMLYYIINAEDGETGKPAYTAVEELYEEASMLVPAGTDTTSAVIAALFFYLIHDDTAQEKLVGEIRSTFSSLDDIKTGKQLSSCTYLQASIDEALRINPHGSSESRRQVLQGGLRIKDDLIPPHTILGGDIFAIHHNAEVFPDPFRFKPERWILGNGVTAENVKACEKSVFSFSYGQCGCPGKGLARMELAVTMSRLLFQYDFRGMPGDTEGQGRPNMMWGRRQKTQFQT